MHLRGLLTKSTFHLLSTLWLKIKSPTKYCERDDSLVVDFTVDVDKLMGGVAFVVDDFAVNVDKLSDEAACVVADFIVGCVGFEGKVVKLVGTAVLAVDDVVVDNEVLGEDGLVGLTVVEDFVEIIC